MEVNSISFFAFLGLSSVIYRYTKKDNAAIMLIAVCNILFYLSGGRMYIPVLLFVVGASYLAAIHVEKCKESDKKPHMGIVIILLLSLLLFFKYYNFASGIINSVFSLIGVKLSVSKHSLVWPLGISFFTFTAIGYVIDVYLNTTKANRDFVKHIAFVGFFPTISSGPIMRFNDFDAQLKMPRSFDYEQVCAGMTRMLWGFVKKLVIADNIGKIVDSIYSSYSDMPAPFLIFAALLYTMQIYADFSGYSEIAVGAAQVMGIKVKENFMRPFLAQNYSDFWARWHISLTTWFKDYVFIPLSFNFRQLGLFSLFIIYPISGIWHGAGWSYIIWGVLNGFFLVFAKKTAKKRRKLAKSNPFYKNRTVKHIIQSAIVYVLFTVTLIFFRLTDITAALSVFAGMFKGWTSIMNIPYMISTLKSIGIGTVSGLLLVFNMALLLVVELKEEKGKTHISEIIRSMKPAGRISVYYGLLILIILFGNMARSSYIYNAF